MSYSDPFNRKFKTLRVSLTTHCNLHCYYCVGNTNIISQKNKYDWKSLAEKILQLDEFLKLKKIRFTGGEPTLYPNLNELVTYIKKHTDTPLYLTTNGVLLKNVLIKLPTGTFKEINLSLDAICPEIFYKITRSYALDTILEAFDFGKLNGETFKINTVILRNFNENQILPLAQWAKSNNVTIRYIEFMNMGAHYNNKNSLFYPNTQVLAELQNVFQLYPLPKKIGDTAVYYQDHDNWKVGFISNQSQPFCSDCDRLRIDIHGKLYGCITQKEGMDFPENIHDIDFWNKLIKNKNSVFKGSPVPMIFIGG